MSESKEARCCCDGFCFEVKPTDNGISIQITAEDAETLKVLKCIVAGCGDVREDPPAGDCCK